MRRLLAERRKEQASLVFHTYRMKLTENTNKSNHLSQNMTACITFATWQGYLHPIKAGHWCAIDTASSLPTVTAFESCLFLHHTSHWKPPPLLTLGHGCRSKQWLALRHQQHHAHPSMHTALLQRLRRALHKNHFMVTDNSLLPATRCLLPAPF